MVNERKKVIYIEVLRAIAVLFVIFNHTSQNGYVRFTLCDPGTIQYWFYMFFSVIAGISVPLFYTISGSVLLGKDETIGYVWKKRVFKYALVLLVFSLIMYLWKTNASGSFSILSFLHQTYSESVIVPYWFLYSYIGYLIGLPILRKAVINMTDHDFYYLFGLWLVFNGLIYVLQYRLSGGTVWMNELLFPSLLTNCIVFYPALGYYLAVKVKKITNKMCIVLLLSTLGSIALTMYLTHYRITLTGDLNESTVSFFFDTYRPLQVVSVYCIVRKLFENRKIPDLVRLLLGNLGSCVFGIYLVEEITRGILLTVYETLSESINGFVAVWIYVIAVFVLSWICVASVRYLYALFCRSVLKKSN